jgi:hypothetical protein
MIFNMFRRRYARCRDWQRWLWRVYSIGQHNRWAHSSPAVRLYRRTRQQVGTVHLQCACVTGQHNRWAHSSPAKCLCHKTKQQVGTQFTCNVLVTRQHKRWAQLTKSGMGVRLYMYNYNISVYNSCCSSMGPRWRLILLVTEGYRRGANSSTLVRHCIL